MSLAETNTSISGMFVLLHRLGLLAVRLSSDTTCWPERTTKNVTTKTVSTRSPLKRQVCLLRLSLVVLPDVDVELGQHLELAFVEDRLVGMDPLLEGLQDL